MTPLCGAVLNGNLELAETLISHKASLEALNRFSNRTLFMVAAEGVTRESTAMMSMLLDHQKILTPPVFSELLIHAIREGRFEMVELLIKRGAPLQATDEQGTTPLHVAIWEGRMKVVERLLAGKADPSAKMEDGETPLKAARERKNKEIEELLLKYGATQ